MLASAPRESLDLPRGALVMHFGSLFAARREAP